jgi:pyruvate dehydrogenase E1 component alpha subunit
MMMYRGVTLEQAYLYWAGYERGNHFNENVRVLPIDVIIGSQINHAAGLAYASKILKKDEVVLTMIGDGGTSTGEFYEGLNFGAVFDVPMVVIIQNNQYAISTPRAKATKSATLAQKAIAFGIPGVQVDGNDILAMYAVTKEAVDYARKGNGPVLIEAVTYRLGAHTTSDDPTIYRHDDEVKAWEAKDPLIRFKQYLMDRKLLTEEADQAFEEEYNKFVQDTFIVVENTGPEELENVFKYTFAEMTPQLKEQYEYMKNFLEKGGSK